MFFAMNVTVCVIVYIDKKDIDVFCNECDNLRYMLYKHIVKKYFDVFSNECDSLHYSLYS